MELKLGERGKNFVGKVQLLGEGIKFYIGKEMKL